MKSEYDIRKQCIQICLDAVVPLGGLDTRLIPEDLASTIEDLVREAKLDIYLAYGDVCVLAPTKEGMLLLSGREVVEFIEEMNTQWTQYMETNPKVICLSMGPFFTKHANMSLKRLQKRL